MPRAKQDRERRQWERLNIAIPVFVRGTDDQGKAFVEFTTALNLCAGGALVVIRHVGVSPHARLSVEVPAAPWPQLATARRKLDGELIRVETVSGCCVAALRFRRPLLESAQRKLKV